MCSSSTGTTDTTTASETFSPLKDATLVAGAGIDEDPVHGAVTPPLYLSTNYSFESFGKKRAYDYTRSGNPTRDQLASALAALEGGHHAVVTSSGLAALDLVFQTLESGDLLVAPHDCYGGTHRLLVMRAKKGHFRLRFCNLTDPAALDEAFEGNPAMILIETPSNPLLRITDIAAIVKRARQAGARVVADNTFLSPALQKPLELGADIVVHSTTKYINGHSDVVGGAVISRTAEQHEKLAWLANCIGVTGAPFDSFLTLRGLRTLPLRIRQQEETASRIAQWLDKHPAVSRVYYPGLNHHPGHTVALRQQKGFGAMLSFELTGDVRRFLEVLSAGAEGLFTLAESLGGFESLVAHPATMTHAAMPAEARRAAGIADNLLRLSVGLEDADDLLDCLRNAFAAVETPAQKTAAPVEVFA
ncbi:MAG: cystathionine gamma-synthase [Alphaproteobacteria bacterium]|nr:cystathionine gamma-synthase [Alphaproteobacteria bacterium]